MNWKFLPFGLLTLTLLLSCNQIQSYKILVITGGHAYDTVNFKRLFDQMEGVETYWLSHPDANAVYASDTVYDFDALVFYDLNQEITVEQQGDFMNMLDEGQGLVFLHHSIASYQDWPEFKSVLGGKYYLEPELVNGDSVAASTYFHDEEVRAIIMDPKHPITKDMSDFDIHEETYAQYEILPEVKAFIRTEHANSGAYLAWTNTYANSRIVYLQFGHDNNAYSHPQFRELLLNAIRWVRK